MAEISKAYEPQSVESKWYQYWLDQKCFVADPARVSARRPAYSIVIPPPNVTGVLHMGHVLNNTIQDILARKARMDGKEVLWLPGTDHAGIATEGMVAKQLRKDEKKSKQEIGREEFLKRVWTWKEKHGGIIIEQLKKLGASCDWTRERFTMDPEYARCVQKVFVDLYRRGLIYRGKRMVNWCPATLTALSDEEVEMETRKGFLWYFQVEVAEEPGTFLTIATTRPETIPGDTAIAVNPKDPRYTRFVGKHAVRPLPVELSREKKLIPIIGDEQVDFEFGTGVLKVTPAHDKADFEIGQRHNLPAVDIMNPNATMNELAGADLSGLDRVEARKVAVDKLRALGALEKEEPYENKIGISDRAKVPIEPRLSEQWFLKYPGVEPSKACVANGTMKFHPERWAKVYDHWMTNIQDWCISRQLWWGHRVPVWTRTMSLDQWGEWRKANKEATDFLFDSNENAKVVVFIHRPDGKDYAITGHDHGRDNLASIYSQVKDGDALTWMVCPTDDALPTTSGVTIKAWLEANGFTQDPDVLDTWFSSWLWPFATMGWTGDKSQDANNPTLRAFYPTTDLVTAPEIIFFWVARMIMAGYEFMGDLPFQNVYFTGIIRDKIGRKMSKTLGNSPDPLDLIAKYGADAVRFGTMRSAPLGQDVMFDEKDVELGRNFCNKLWNACRFRQMQGGEVQAEIDPNKLRSDDKWILLKLHQAIKEITEALNSYNFSIATQTLYRFFWGEYCDWYVEASKAVLGRPDAVSPESGAASASAQADPRRAAIRTNTLAVMDFVLSHTLRLFHPFLPFITEELWHGMGYIQDMPAEQGARSIMSAPWPKSFDSDFRDHYSLDDCYLDFVNAKFELVTQGRNLRREANVAANKKVKFIIKPAEQLVPNDIEVIKLLLNAEELEINPEYEAKKGTISTHAQLGELYLPLEGIVDLAAEGARLTRELEKIAEEIIKVEQKLNNPAFVQKVPPAVLQDHQKRLADWLAKQAHVRKSLDDLKSN